MLNRGSEEQPQRATIFVMLVLGLIFLSALGCKNPFSTRESSPPLGTTGTWETPATPDIAIKNLFYAYNEKNIENYKLCLDWDFQFSAYEDSVEAVNNGNAALFADWNYDAEIAVTQQIFSTFSGSDTSSLFLNIELDSPADVEEDSTALLIRNYELLIISKSDSTSDTTVALGQAAFGLVEAGLAGWVVRTWSDTPDTTGGFDWGDFKALFRYP